MLALTLFADLSQEILIAIYATIGVFAFFMLLLGLAWATVISLRWEYRHTVIAGKRLVFKGKKTALWGNYLKWFFLSVITILLYTFWIGAKFGKWVLKNVETVESKEEKNTEQNAVNAYLPAANPYFPPYPPMPNMPTMPQANNAPQGQMPMGYFPPYPCFPPYAPYPCANEQCKKEN